MIENSRQEFLHFAVQLLIVHKGLGERCCLKFGNCVTDIEYHTDRSLYYMLGDRIFCETHLRVRNSNVEDDMHLKEFENGGIRRTSSVTLRDNFGIFTIIINYDW